MTNRGILINIRNIIILLSLITALFSIVCLNLNSKQIDNAYADTTSLVKVSKIKTLVSVDSLGNITHDELNDELIDETTSESLVEYYTSSNFIKINNDELIEAIKSNEAMNDIETEYVKVSFGLTDITLKSLTRSATLNGQSIVVPDVVTSSSNASFSFKLFGTSNEVLKQNTNGTTSYLESSLGEYIFNFTYREYTTSGGTGTEKSTNFTFRLLTNYDYSFTDVNNADVNTYNLYNTYTSTYQESDVNTSAHYYNYNNFYTGGNDGTLNYPTIKYDVSKYLLSYTKIVYNTVENVTSSIVINADRSAVVTFISTINSVSETTIVNIANIDTNPFINLVFEDIGTYQFNFNYIIETTSGTMIQNTNLTKVSKTLSLFGYQLKYADSGTGSSELKSVDNNLYADISYLNSTYISKGLNQRSTSDLTFNLNGGNSVEEYIPTTNQAPIWLDYIGTLSNAFYYYFSSTSTLDYDNLTYGTANNYKKNDYFTNAGLYVLIVNYTNNTTATYTQIFAFEIKNTPPVVSIYSVDDEVSTILYNDGYTNKDVQANFVNASLFNASLSATYTQYDFSGNIVKSDVTFNSLSSTSPTTLTENGYYILKVKYGNSAYTYSTYKFTIDKSNISDIKVLNNATDYTAEVFNYGLINGEFNITWGAKASGAEIYAEYQCMLLMKDAEYSFNDSGNITLDGDDVYLWNGYRTSSISSTLSFSNGTTTFSNQGLYVCKLYDEAGNVTYFVILLDETNPSLQFSPDLTNNYNIIKENTTVTFGTHKAIYLDYTDIDTNTDNLLDIAISNGYLNDTLYDLENGLSLIKVGLTSKILKSAEAESDIAYADEEHLTTASVDISVDNLSEDVDEYFYDLTITDVSQILPYSTTGVVNTLLEVNLDASQVLAFMTRTSDYNRLYKNGASNQNLLYLNYYAEQDGFIVEELYYDFYPLTLDTTSSNYPYAENPSFTESLLTSVSQDSNDLTKKRTANINTSYSQSLETEVTQIGMYIVTRIYEYNYNFTDAYDTNRTKTYTYYIDRTAPIANITVDTPLSGTTDDFSRTVGENIYLKLGADEVQQVFNELLLATQSSTQSILSTDLLPVNVQLPSNKYSVLADTGLDYTIINDYNLTFKLYFKPAGGIDTLSFVSDLTLSEFVTISSMLFRKIGTYTLTIYDQAGYDIYDSVTHVKTASNESPNSFTFKIQITKTYPTGTYYGTPNADGTDKAIQNLSSASGINNISSTSDDELKFVFTDSSNPYKANIQYTDVKVERKAKGATTFENAITVQFTQTSYDGSITSLDLTDLSETIGFKEILVDTYGQQVFNTNGEPIYKYTIILPTNTDSTLLFEGQYKITIHYYGDKVDYYENAYYSQTYGSTYDYVNYYENATQATTIVIDHTAPTFNLLRLVYADKYLPATSLDSSIISKQDIIDYVNNLITDETKAETIRQFLRTYAFAIDEDYVFEYATNTGYSTTLYPDYTYPLHDTLYVYFRQYDKYSNSDNAEQSYVKSDPEYTDSSKRRFEMANTDDYTSFSYVLSTASNSQSFSEMVEDSGLNDGYYEIIEIDQAGNQRVYTVYVETDELSLTFDNTEDNSEIDIIGNASNSVLSLKYDYVLSAINNLDSWSTIKIYDKTSTSTLLQTFDINYDTDIEEIIEEINSYIDYSSIYSSSGAYYEINLLNRFGDDLTIQIKRPGSELEYSIVEYSITFAITLPTSTSSTWIENFIVKQYNAETNTLETITRDLNGAISSTNFSNVIYNFNSGEYYFYLIDNFARGETSPIHYIFNIDDVKDLTFDDVYINNSDELPVTADDVTFSYQEKLYNITVFYDDMTLPYDYTSDQNISVSYDDSTYIYSLLFNAIDDEIHTYKIIVSYNTQGLDIETEDIEFCFIIDTRLPNLYLTDASGNDFNYLLYNGSTSSEIYVHWDSDTDYAVTVSITRTYNGSSSTMVLNQGNSIYLIGSYVITMRNTLNYTYTASFSITKNTAILYNVYDTDGNLLSASLTGQQIIVNSVYNNETISINTLVKVFVNINEMSVIANENKSLQAKKVYEYIVSNSYKLVIYKIYGSSTLVYEEYIVLLQLDTSIMNLSNLKIGSASDAMTSVNGISASYTTPNVYLTYDNTLSLSVTGATSTWTFNNFNYVDLYYNNTLVDTFYSSSFDFSDTGDYKLYFKNIAGYVYTFTSGSKINSYYTISLLNSVSILVNGTNPINYAIYNDAVAITITNTDKYDKSSFSISMSLNGTLINDLKDYYVNSEYVFSKYGLYQIYLSAKMGGKSISSSICFTIFSDDEALVSHNFTPITGYEITSIIKEGIDITNTFKTTYNLTAISSYSFSTDNLDNGYYTIEVNAKTSTYKPVQTFTYSFWINSGEIYLDCSIDFGESTTSNITIKYYPYSIVEQYGHVILKITGMSNIEIFSSSGENTATELQLTENQVYYIQFYTESGVLLASYRVEKVEPLNTVAIITIIGASIVVLGIIALFVYYRTKMRVR